jgi:hypothetical protein
VARHLESESVDFLQFSFRYGMAASSSLRVRAALCTLSCMPLSTASIYLKAIVELVRGGAWLLSVTELPER